MAAPRGPRGRAPAGDPRALARERVTPNGRRLVGRIPPAPFGRPQLPCVRAAPAAPDGPPPDRARRVAAIKAPGDEREMVAEAAAEGAEAEGVSTAPAADATTAPPAAPSCPLADADFYATRPGPLAAIVRAGRRGSWAGLPARYRVSAAASMAFVVCNMVHREGRRGAGVLRGRWRASGETQPPPP